MPTIIGRSTIVEGGPPRFDSAVPESGYRWWYVDGISEDGRDGIVVIGFVGSVFSPYYYRARARGQGDAQNFCAINVGLYRRRGKLWAMTERGRSAVARGRDWFEVGPSGFRWRDDRLEIDIRERSAPLGKPLRGRVVVRPDYLNENAFQLDASGYHSWRPIAPSAHIEVSMQAPRLQWAGRGYIDSNAGRRALERDFLYWNWSRCEQPSKTGISYAVTPVSGEERTVALTFRDGGRLDVSEAPAPTLLPRTGWGIERLARSVERVSLIRTLEDTPFYARSLLQERRAGRPRLLMHESLDLERFSSAWVRALLPFRMPRRS